MKALPSRFCDYLWRFGLIVVVYIILYQVMARTGMIERVMALNFDWWELVLIVLFLVSRFLTYLFIAPALLALAVYHGAKALLASRSHSTAPR